MPEPTPAGCARSSTEGPPAGVLGLQAVLPTGEIIRNPAAGWAKVFTGYDLTQLTAGGHPGLGHRGDRRCIRGSTTAAPFADFDQWRWCLRSRQRPGT